MNKTMTLGFISAAAIAMTFSDAATAQGDGGYYVSGFAGLAFQSDNTNTPVIAGSAGVLDLDYSSGFTLGGSVGYRLPEGILSGLRLELEASYREGDVSQDSLFGNNITNLDFSGDTSSFAVLANVIYDFDFLESELFTPYIGFGVGLGGVESDVFVSGEVPDVLNEPTSLVPFSEQFGGATRTQFVYQAIAGVSFPITEQFDLFVDGRYYSAGDVEFDLVSEFTGAETPFNSDYDVFQLQAGFRFKF